MRCYGWQCESDQQRTTTRRQNAWVNCSSLLLLHSQQQYTAQQRTNSQTKHGRTDKRTESCSSSTLLFRRAAASEANAVVALSVSRSSPCYTLCTMYYSTGPFVVVPSLTTYRYLRAQLRAETIYSERRKSLMSFLNSFTGFWLTHTYSAYCLMAQLCRLDRSCLKN